MTIKRPILALFLFSIWYVSFGQTKDFGIWYSGNVSHEIFKNTEIGLGATVRTNQNASHTDQFFFDGGITYKFNKYVSLSGNYRWIFKDENNNGFFSRYRYYTDLKLSYPLYNFKLSTRFRFQGQYKQYAEKPEDKLPGYFARCKTQVYYNWPFSPFNPYVGMEWFYPIGNDINRSVDQKRFSAGIQYKINKKHTLEAEFIFQREYQQVLNDLGVFSVSYGWEF